MERDFGQAHLIDICHRVGSRLDQIMTAEKDTPRSSTEGLVLIALLEEIRKEVGQPLPPEDALAIIRGGIGRVYNEICRTLHSKNASWTSNGCEEVVRNELLRRFLHHQSKPHSADGR